MKIVCDNCSTKYSIADEKVRGKVFKIKCKKCSHIIVVKGQDGSAVDASGAPAGGFDQKETKVFDYSGFDQGQGGAAAGAAGGGGAAAEPIWHLVIDREQVGPLSVSELQQKWGAGEVDADTYAWREGFGDWQRLGAIDELAFLRGGAAASASPPAADAGAGRMPSMFGGGDDGHTSRADPADLFAAAAASGGDDDGAGDLFGQPRAAAAEPVAMQPVVAAGGGMAASASASPSRRSVPKDDLFAASADGGGLGV